MSNAWLDLRERGSLVALRLMTWLALTVGYRVTGALLYPICLYYLAFSPCARRASRDYLKRVLGRPARLREVFRHFHVFAGALLDRVAIHRDNGDDFAVRVHGSPALDAALRTGRGCLLLGSHLGSFEVMRTIGEMRRGMPVNLVMHEGNAPHASRWTRALAPELAQRVIAPGEPETLLRVQACFARGEIVAMLGDRALTSERAVVCEFFGGQARFPAGPLYAAALLEVPVVLFFCLRRGARDYDAYLELLAERVAAPDAARAEVIAACVARYAQRLEHYARTAPYNWFNFYNFWQGLP